MVQTLKQLMFLVTIFWNVTQMSCPILTKQKIRGSNCLKKLSTQSIQPLFHRMSFLASVTLAKKNWRRQKTFICTGMSPTSLIKILYLVKASSYRWRCCVFLSFAEVRKYFAVLIATLRKLLLSGKQRKLATNPPKALPGQATMKMFSLWLCL
jgi:hypothetical protein